MLAQAIFTEAPYYLRRPEAGMSEQEFSEWRSARLEGLILAEGHDTIAAFIGQPILGTGGILPPPDVYCVAIQKVLNKIDILPIATEVVTGFGRRGSMFVPSPASLPGVISKARTEIEYTISLQNGRPRDWFV